jgi:hypothetical protein
LVELPSFRLRCWRAHGGRACVTEHPSAEARYQEEDHERNRRDSEVTVCAVRSSRSSCLLSSFYSSHLSSLFLPIVTDGPREDSLGPSDFSAWRVLSLELPMRHVHARGRKGWHSGTPRTYTGVPPVLLRHRNARTFSLTHGVCQFSGLRRVRHRRQIRSCRRIGILAVCPNLLEFRLRFLE